MREHQLYIGGGWRKGGGTATAVSPSSGEVFATLAVADPADVGAAVTAAAAAWPAWSRWSAFERAGWCDSVAAAITSRREELARALTEDQGKPLATEAGRWVSLRAIRMHYNEGVFKAVRDSDWSASHVAAHGVTLDEVREAILERPYWAAAGRDGTILIYGRTYAGRYLLVVAIAEAGEAFIVTARDMTGAEKKTFRRKAR